MLLTAFVGGALADAVDRRRMVQATDLVDINAMFFGMPNALFPALALHHGGAEVLGLLYTAPAVGAFLATLMSGWTRGCTGTGSRCCGPPDCGASRSPCSGSSTRAGPPSSCSPSPERPTWSAACSG